MQTSVVVLWCAACCKNNMVRESTCLYLLISFPCFLFSACCPRQFWSCNMRNTQKSMKTSPSALQAWRSLNLRCVLTRSLTWRGIARYGAPLPHKDNFIFLNFLAFLSFSVFYRVYARQRRLRRTWPARISWLSWPLTLTSRATTLSARLSAVTRGP